MPGTTSDTNAPKTSPGLDPLGLPGSAVTLLAAKLKKTILDFEKNPMTGTREIREYSESFPNEFLEGAVAVLLETMDTPGGVYLLKLLLAQGSLVALICSPFHLRQEQAHLLVERSKRIDPFFEWKLFRQASDEVERGWEGDMQISMRALDLLSITARSAHQIPVVKKLLHHPNPKVRSRAATLMAKVTREMDWVPASLEDSEARVRANALETFWNTGTPDSLKPLLWTALSDTDNRVVGNALLGLHRQGDRRTVCLMLEMATDPVERFRATAVWLLGQTGQKELLPEVQKLVRDPSVMVRRAAVRSARNLNSIVVPPPVETAATDSPEAANSPKDGTAPGAATPAESSNSVETVPRHEVSERLKLLLEKPGSHSSGDANRANKPRSQSSRHSSHRR
ncbi:MAG TPA: HEAT repeat domain-containing protein [Bryobacteraceae bacterium]|nr:HEAT repeat domain-containing protein [Bryobacteraceae bacterium]